VGAEDMIFFVVPRKRSRSCIKMMRLPNTVVVKLNNIVCHTFLELNITGMGGCVTIPGNADLLACFQPEQTINIDFKISKISNN
jgi:hypothetical protein